MKSQWRTPAPGEGPGSLVSIATVPRGHPSGPGLGGDSDLTRWARQMCGCLSPGLSKLGCCPATAPAGVLHLGARWGWAAAAVTEGCPHPHPQACSGAPPAPFPPAPASSARDTGRPEPGLQLPFRSRPGRHGACTFHTCTVLHPSSCLGEPQNSRQEKADSLETGHAVTRPAPAPAPERRGSLREAVRVPGRGGGGGGTMGPLLPTTGQGRAGMCLVLSQRESMLGTGSVFKGNE